MTTRKQLLCEAVERLRMAKIETPELDARVLLKDALKLSDAELIAAQDATASPEGEMLYRNLVCRRISGEPVARILGHREFWGLRFELGPDTLVPRPDTETLVEAALASFGRADAPRVLDLGTGTGCILLAILHELSLATGTGVDISPEAVETARRNAKNLNLSGRAHFVVSDWDQRIDEQFDLIVSNPPYIPSGHIPELSEEVRLHDPMRALDGGKDGLIAYRALAACARRRLAPNGVLVAELGIGQEADVAALMRDAGLKVDGPARSDLGGVPRALVVRG